MAKFRVIPFTSLGKQNGMLLGIKADGFSIQAENENVEVPNVIIGISTHDLTKNGLYSALVGLDILEGSKTHESFEFAKNKY